MTAQIKALAEPALKEAVKGVLYVGKLKEDAHAEVAPYQNSAAGDEVVLYVTTSTGNNFDEKITLSPGTVGQLLIFAIPKSTFEKNLARGATAKLHYTVSRAGNVSHSQVLTVQLER